MGGLLSWVANLAEAAWRAELSYPPVHVEELQMNPETARFGGHHDEHRALSLASLCQLAAGYAGHLRHCMRG